MKTEEGFQNLISIQGLPPFSIDTRTLKPGDLFFALDGAHEKGHVYLQEALRKGALAGLCAERYRENIRQNLSDAFYQKAFFVDEPILELAKLAHQHRCHFLIPIVGVAGSVGKTSTKQFLAYLLSRTQSVLATAGNLNNHFGLPIMLSRLKPEHKIAVFEMGADHVGDLKKLVQIAEPTIGVLTPIAPEHLLGFGSLAGVYDGELELLLSPRIHTLITVEGDAELDRRIKNWKGQVIRVGFSESADIQISNLRVENNQTHFDILGQPITLQTPASFLAVNAGLAVATATKLGYDKEALAGEWLSEMPQGRFTIRKMARDLTVIDDTYNSSPRAFAAALESLSQMSFSRKWLVFSDMLELGSESEYWHQDLSRNIAGTDLYAVHAFGSQSRFTIDALRKQKIAVHAAWFENPEALAESLISQVRPGDAILFKGSRGMKVERVLEILEAKL